MAEIRVEQHTNLMLAKLIINTGTYDFFFLYFVRHLMFEKVVEAKAGRYFMSCTSDPSRSQICASQFGLFAEKVLR